MELDDILKTILILSISGAIVTLTFFFTRILHQIFLMLKDTRAMVNQAKMVTESVSNTVIKVRDVVQKRKEMIVKVASFSSVASSVGVFAALRKLAPWKKSKQNKED